MRQPSDTDARVLGTQPGPIDWTSAIERHSGWLRTVLRCRTGDGQAVEDLLQDVVLAALTQNSRPTDPGKVAPWLYRVAVRQAIQHRRKLGRRRRRTERGGANAAGRRTVGRPGGLGLTAGGAPGGDHGIDASELPDAAWPAPDAAPVEDLNRQLADLGCRLEWNTEYLSRDLDDGKRLVVPLHTLAVQYHGQ